MGDLYSTAYVDPYAGVFDVRVPPTEFLVFPFGPFTTEHGEFLFDEESAKTVMDAYARKGVDAVIDYEHQGLQDPPIQAPNAASRWVPQIRDGALWATDVKWTDKAWLYLCNAEYRYISPAFSHEPKAPRRVLEVINLALVNIPAMHGQEALVRASGRPTKQGEPDMDELKKLQEQVADLTARLKAAEEAKTALSAANAELTTQLSAAKAGKEAGEELETITAALSIQGGGRTERTAALSQLTQLRSAVLSIAGSDNVTTALGKLHAMKASSEEVARLSAKLAEVEDAAIAKEFEEVLTNGTKGSPAKRDELKVSILKSTGGKPTRQAIEIARACLSALPTIPAGAVGQPEVKAPPSGEGGDSASFEAVIANVAGPVGGWQRKKPADQQAAKG